MPKRQNISNKTILNIGRQMKAELGASLTPQRFCDRTGLAHELINQRFGSWQRFRRLLGLTMPARATKTRKRRFTDDELLAHLRRLGAENPNITLIRFCIQVDISRIEIYERFESWRNMRESAGLPRMVQRAPDYSEEEILSDLLKIYFKAGRCPGYHDLKRWGGKVSASTLRARYGSWQGVKIRLEIYRREYMARTDPNWSWEQEREERRRQRGE